MSIKSIFIILCSVLLTIILMNNTEEMSFWLFGETKISKLAVLTGLFFGGWLLGYLMGRSGSKNKKDDSYTEYEEEATSSLSDDDREYIR